MGILQLAHPSPTLQFASNWHMIKQGNRSHILYMYILHLEYEKDGHKYNKIVDKHTHKQLSWKWKKKKKKTLKILAHGRSKKRNEIIINETEEKTPK